MNETFLMQFVGAGFGACFGGFAAWVAIKVDVAIAKQRADDAKASAGDAHNRLDEHIDRHHTRPL